MPDEFIQYRAGDAFTAARLQARNGHVCLSQAEMMELREVTPSAISDHIGAIHGKGEVEPDATGNDYSQVRIDGNRRASGPISHDILPLNHNAPRKSKGDRA